MSNGKRSLTEGLESIGKSRSSGGGKSKAETMKLGLAIGLFLVAGLVLAWYYDFLPFGGAKPVGIGEMSPQQQQQLEQSQQIMEQQLKRPDVIQGSS